jgi:hypothetical protein
MRRFLRGLFFRRLLGLGLCLPAGFSAAGEAAPVVVSGPAPALPESAGAAHGRLKVSSFFLEAPDEVLRLAEAPDQRPVWRFPGRDPRVALEALAQAGLGAAGLAALSAPGAFAVEVDKVSFLPSLDLLVGLGPQVREAVYLLLAGNGLNPLHSQPQRIQGQVDDWMKGSILSVPQQALFRSLLWRGNGSWVFSDLAALSLLATSAAEVQEARRIMTRVRTLRVTVMPPAAGGGSRFRDYWLAAGMNPTVAPLLNAALEAASEDGIDLALLLPTLARERLYTYPTLNDAIAGRLPDCNWTSLNFFAARPSTYYLDGRTSFLTLTQEYEQVPRAERLGDVIAFVTADGIVIHTCVHIAGDIVFTKNGQLLFAPWLLQPLADVVAIYGGEGRALRFFRPKPGPG